MCQYVDEDKCKRIGKYFLEKTNRKIFFKNSMLILTLSILGDT